MRIYKTSLKRSPLPVPPKGGKLWALQGKKGLHFIRQSGSTDFQPCKGEIFVARDQARYSRPRDQVEKGANLISDEMELTSKRSIQKLILTFLLIGIWTIANSQQTDSLSYYLAIAAKNNPTVLQKFAEYQASLQKIPQVGSLPDPELNVGVFLSPMEQLSGNQVADIRLMQMFPWFGVLKNAKDEMSLMAKAKYESFRDAQLQVYFDVQRTWYELYKIRQNIQISDKNIEILRSIERLAIVRFKAAPARSGTSTPGRAGSTTSGQSTSPGSSGMNTMGGSSGNSVSNQPDSPMPAGPMGSSSGSSGLSDVYRIQIEIGELQNAIELLKNQLVTISAQFNSYLNRPPVSAVSIPDALMPLNFEPSQIAISDSILNNNPMLGMLHYEHQSLEARKQMVTRMSYPMIGLGLNYSLINKSEMSTSAMNGKDMIMPMVTVTLPIYRKKYKAMQTETEFLKSANSENIKATANSLQTEYYQALQSYQDALRRTKLYADQYRLASKTLDILFKSFASSSVELTDILRVRQQTFDYEYKQAEAVADYNISIAWIKRLGNIEISRIIIEIMRS